MHKSMFYFPMCKKFVFYLTHDKNRFMHKEHFYNNLAVLIVLSMQFSRTIILFKIYSLGLQKIIHGFQRKKNFNAIQQCT